MPVLSATLCGVGNVIKKLVCLPLPVQLSHSGTLLAQRAAPQYRRPDGSL
jgi:hypothetical protein